MSKSHEVDYQVFGDDLQFVEIELDPKETVIAEAVAHFGFKSHAIFHIFDEKIRITKNF